MGQSATPQALPKYIQISERLIREIAAGRIVDGARLAPEREMAAELGIAVGTLRKSLKDLESKGLLERIQGSGNYVRHKPTVASVYSLFRLELLAGGGLPTAEALSIDRIPKPQDAPAFGSSKDAFRIRRLRRLDDQEIAMEEIWLDGSYGSEILISDLSDSLYFYYREQLNLVIATVTDSIGLDAAPEWSDPRFGLKAGAAAGFIERVGWTAEGIPAEYSRTWFNHKKARYISRMGKG